ncbi:NACHT, LRR and PYD domains-containing protein 12-like [Leucoraja erinacea]|uniref:NACHT, LRR and PYD domains-containing protein 12-like n=1 Tax=Leucoraja erinaceus TaxID=7782 RepID=UPI002458925C|nr:NACHT, LRR and PYD domains-containing protein 12-like [Leucoraja erinacea]
MAEGVDQGGDSVASTMRTGDAPPMSSMMELLERCDDSQLLDLTNHYRQRLEEAIQEEVKNVAFVLAYEKYFSEQEYKQVIKRTKRGSRAAGSTLLLNLVTEKEPRVLKLIWKCFVKMHHLLPELKAMEEEGSDLIESFKNMKLSSELPTDLEGTSYSSTIVLCDTIKHLDLDSCSIQCEGLQWLKPILHKCQHLSLGDNDLGNSGVKLVSEALRNPDCKIQTLGLNSVGLTVSGAVDLASALSTNHTVTKLVLSGNKLGDSGVKLVSEALRNPDCKIQTLWLGSVGLTDSGAKDLVSTLSTKPSLTNLCLTHNSLTDLCVPALRRLIPTFPRLEQIR